jgi:hypothetical protein
MSMLVSNIFKCFNCVVACLLELNLHEKKASRDVNMEENVEEGGIFVDPSYCQKTIDNHIFIIDHHFALD